MQVRISDDKPSIHSSRAHDDVSQDDFVATNLLGLRRTKDLSHCLPKPYVE